MELIRFEDKCVVSRAVGYDDDGNEVVEQVYNGPCLYKQGGQTYPAFSQRNSLLTISGDVAIRENDLVVVEQGNGIRRECKVKTVRNIKMPLTGTRYTRLEMQYDKELVISD